MCNLFLAKMSAFCLTTEQKFQNPNWTKLYASQDIKDAERQRQSNIKAVRILIDLHKTSLRCIWPIKCYSFSQQGWQSVISNTVISTLLCQNYTKHFLPHCYYYQFLFLLLYFFTSYLLLITFSSRLLSSGIFQSGQSERKDFSLTGEVKNWQGGVGWLSEHKLSTSYCITRSFTW